MAEHRLGMLVVSGLVYIHNVQASSCHVVHIEKFSPRCAGTPDGDTGRFVDLSLVEAANQAWDHMRVFMMVVITDAVQVGGHDTTIIRVIFGGYSFRRA